MFLGWIWQNFGILGLRAEGATAIPPSGAPGAHCWSPGPLSCCCSWMLIQNPSQHSPSHFRTKETEIQEDALEWSGLAFTNKCICYLGHKDTRFSPFTGKEAKGRRRQWAAGCWHTWSSYPHSCLPISKWPLLWLGRVKTLGHIAIPFMFWLLRQDWAHLVVRMHFSSAVSLDTSSSWTWAVNRVMQIMFY